MDQLTLPCPSTTDLVLLEAALHRSPAHLLAGSTSWPGRIEQHGCYGEIEFVSVQSSPPLPPPGTPVEVTLVQGIERISFSTRVLGRAGERLHLSRPARITQQDRRVHPRVPLRPEHHVQFWPALGGGGEVQVLDLSVGGLTLEFSTTELTVLVGEWLAGVLCLGREHSIALSGRVRWLEPRGGGRARAGLRFEGLSEEYRQLLQFRVHQMGGGRLQLLPPLI